MAEVKFKRIEDSTDIDNVPVVDGQIIYTKDGKNYLDYENERVNIYGGTPSDYKILWENENPSSYDSGTITFNSSDYDMVIWLFKLSSTDPKIISSTSIKNYGSVAQYCNETNEFTRTITYVDDTTYTMSYCRYSPGSTAVSSTRLIPIYAIGYKTNLFGE